MMCKNCEQGHVPLGEYIVTPEMAMDAGDPSLAGMPMGIEWDRCDCCNGNWQDCKNCEEDVFDEFFYKITMDGL